VLHFEAICHNPLNLKIGSKSIKNCASAQASMALETALDARPCTRGAAASNDFRFQIPWLRN
jgi:LSD1 subclass zinc finger protein